MVFLLAAGAALIERTAARSQRLAYLSTIGAPAEDAAGANGRTLPVPSELDASFQWLEQTQRMLDRGEARVRHIDYENAPFGRPVLAPSPYRWWLGFLAWCDHLATGRTSAAVLEGAALVADPILWGIIVLGSALLSAKYFGSLSAAAVSVALVSLFPFVDGFWPGAPDDRGLAEALALASVLLLSLGTAAGPDKASAKRRWFMLAGIVGGLGLWVKVPVQLPVVWGIVLGGLCVSRLAPALPWRTWGWAGAATTIVAALIEYAPAQLGKWELSFVHPLHGLAWLGAGELLTQAGRPVKRPVLVGLSFAALIAVPALLVVHHGSALFVLDVMSGHLTRDRAGFVAPGWLWLTLAPLGVLIPAVWVLRNALIKPPTKAAVALSLGPVVVGLAFACVKLAWWQTLDALLVVTLAAMAPALSFSAIGRKASLTWISVLAVVLAPGLIYVVGADRPTSGGALNRSELQELIVRDVAGWIRQHSGSGGTIVLSPPDISNAMCYYGAFRGLGSASEANRDGISAVIRIMSIRNLQEAKEMFDRRKITHLVLLSWDDFFADLARAADGQIAGTFIDQLTFTTLPRWLRPLAYPSPSIPDFEDRSVTVFEVVPEQDEATSLSNIALYLAETGDLDHARLVAEGLTRFSTDVGTWVTRAQVAAAVHDDAELAKDLQVLQSRLALRVQPLISWSRRVDLAVVLARAKATALARKQLTICLNNIDDDRIRSLSPQSVYRLLVLSRGLGVPMPPAQHALALSLVPSNLRARL